MPASRGGALDRPARPDGWRLPGRKNSISRTTPRRSFHRPLNEPLPPRAVVIEPEAIAAAGVGIAVIAGRRFDRARLRIRPPASRGDVRPVKAQHRPVLEAGD